MYRIVDADNGGMIHRVSDGHVGTRPADDGGYPTEVQATAALTSLRNRDQMVGRVPYHLAL